MADETLNEAEEMDAVNGEENVAEEANSADSAESNAPETEDDDTPKVLTVEEKLAAAEAQAAENLEGWQRARAEFDNARKRFQKARVEARTNAKVDIAEQLLPVLDDFDLAFGNTPEEIRETEWFGGVGLIPRKMAGILEKIGIQRIGTIGEPFDPNFHNAIMREDSAEYDTDTVIREFQGGYKIGDRVIRPAIVVVAS
ncbi:MAG: nucleotide exchange factor GrpE [Candidatus Promineifilaceae bacterium]